ncbi:MAG: phospho-sugar mutase [Spirochaetales bacterium]|nr:phospho-sugar mutase [Spirochaetales bacterium]
MNKENLLKKAQEYLSLENSQEFREDLQKVIDANDYEELNDRFYRELEFGTGGLRGVIGGGFNRMNPYTVSQATQGLANYINENVTTNKSVVIAFDSRNYSEEFAKSAAMVLAGNGIKVYLFPTLQPTPVLSFAVRYLNATSGIVVTASHNPAKYNGYKAYWNNGAQVISPVDKGIIEKVRNVGSSIKTISEKEALDNGSLTYLDKEIENKFIETVKKYSIRPEVIKEYAKTTSIVYTPLHGTGRVLIERLFTELGISYDTVAEQAEPDGNFPTAPFPNPEIAEAMQMALDLAASKKADLVMGTDPDADRLGIAVPDPSGKYVLITGNQLGCMILHYMLESYKEKGIMPKNPAAVKTIVTTQLAIDIANSFNVKSYDVLTGFKWIAAAMEEMERLGESYIFGFEESYGYLVEKETRDKDAISAAFMTAELALYCKSKGISLLDYLNSIYKKYGYYKEFLISKYFEGEKGLKIMQGLMDNLRADTPSSFGGLKVTKIRDLKSSEEFDVATERTTQIELPSSNVMQFILEDGTVFTARPSGTEPKIKFYGSCCRSTENGFENAQEQVNSVIAAIEEDVNQIINSI